MVSTYLHNSKLILSRKKASMQASIKIKQTFHIAHTISSQVRLKQGWTAEASQLYRVVFALNPDIESQGEADER